MLKSLILISVCLLLTILTFQTVTGEAIPEAAPYRYKGGHHGGGGYGGGHYGGGHHGGGYHHKGGHHWG